MKFVFINEDKKKEIHISAFLNNIPAYLKNVPKIFNNKNITSNDIKQYGKQVLEYIEYFKYKKEVLPFDEDAFDIVKMNYELVSNEIINLQFFYEANLFSYFERTMHGLIYIMNDILNTPFKHNIEDIDTLCEAIHLVEDWINMYYPKNGWYNSILDIYIDDDIYSLLNDIGNTFYTMGIEGYTGYLVQ